MKKCGCSTAVLLVISLVLFFAIAGLEWWIWKDVFVQIFNAPDLTYWQVIRLDFLVFIFSAIFIFLIKFEGVED